MGGSRVALSGKVVVVTGSTRGIGRAIAEGCANRGAHVVLNSRTSETVANAVEDLRAAGCECTGLAGDVSREEDVRALFDLARQELGGIDAWVNNAGISSGYRPLDELSAEELRRVIDINLTGTALACRLLVPYFRNRGGVIMNVTGRGYRGQATPYSAAYAATKTAVVSLTLSVARENLGAPLSVHALVPGMVPTGFYEDIQVSPRLEASRGNVELALDAFGVSLDTVRAEAPRFLDQDPGQVTGRVYSLLTPARVARGMAKVGWWRLTGRMVRQP